MVASIKHYGGSICDDRGLISFEEKRNNNDRRQKNNESLLTTMQCKKIVRDRAMGLAMIKRGYKPKFGNLLTKMR